MSVSHSPSYSKGLVDGKPVEFIYKRDPMQLSYTSLEGGNIVTLEGADIIGIYQGKAEVLENYSILYVEGTYEPTDAKSAQSAPTLKSIVATSLPEGVVQDFQIRLLENTQEKSSNGANTATSIHIIVSTLSGTGLAVNLFDKVVRPFLAHLGPREDVDYQVHHTQSADTVSELTTSIFFPRANEGIPQYIILLSGDGGVVDTINMLLSSPPSPNYIPPSIVVLPTGTGNALAHSTGITHDNTFGLATLVRGVPAQLPLFRATFSPGARLLVDEGSREEELPLRDKNGLPVLYGAVVCSWGLHASLVADSDTAAYRKYGAERFQMAAKEALFPADGSAPHRYRARVSSLRRGEGREERWEAMERTEHMYVLVTLVSKLENGFTISPGSRPLDGRMWLVEFGPMSGEEVMRVMELAYRGGKHVDEEGVGYEEVEGVRIEFQGLEEEARWRKICVDGKMVRVEKEGWVEMKKEERRVVDVVRLP